MKVSKMIKQAMANAKLQNPKTSGDYRRAWINAIKNSEHAKKNAGKKIQEAASEE